ncbi:MAG: hypothetical protein Q8P05_01395 [Candidatus Diapherotrites archaeon]|nr:hypothetical protein [Candidatus Diapherotrites archaeon]MDZ4256870.1 hypothetical protein [archaeon]
MKLYQKQLPGWEIVSALKDGKWIPLALGIVLLVLIGALLLDGATQPIALSFSKNPVSLSQNESTVLEVTISNPTGQPTYGLVIRPTVIDQEQVSISPEQQTISSLGAQEKRKLQFLVLPLNPTSHPFLPGSYRIEVSVGMNEQSYSQAIFLNVEK